MRAAHDVQRARHRRGARARLAVQQHDREIGHQHASYDRRGGVREEGKLEAAPGGLATNVRGHVIRSCPQQRPYPRAHRIGIERLRKKLDRHIGWNQRPRIDLTCGMEQENRHAGKRTLDLRANRALVAGSRR